MKEPPHLPECATGHPPARMADQVAYGSARKPGEKMSYPSWPSPAGSLLMAKSLQRLRLDVEMCRVLSGGGQGGSRGGAADGRRNVADAVLLERSGPVASLVLNRPDKHNALRFADLDRLVELLHEAEEDDDVRVIVLRGRGPSFCSGHDYDDAARSYGLEPGPDGAKPRRPSQRSRLATDRRLGMNYMAFQYSLKPVIAQVHGVCTGAGLYLVELVDLAIAADTAR